LAVLAHVTERQINTSICRVKTQAVKLHKGLTLSHHTIKQQFKIEFAMQTRTELKLPQLHIEPLLADNGQ